MRRVPLAEEPVSRVLVVFVVLAVLARPAAAAAPPLELAIAGCEPADEARLRELVAIEMGTVAAQATGSASPPRPAFVRLACAGGRATIEVSPEPGARATRSELDLAAAAPATRLRILALTITELVAQGWAAPTAPAATTPASASAAGIGARAAEPSPAPRYSLFVGTSARRMARPATWLGGLDVGLTRALGDVTALVVDVRAEAGEGTTSLARVGWRQLTLTGALALGTTRARWAAHVAPGWSVGYASLTGRPDAPGASGAVVGGVWTGPSLVLRGRRSVGRAGFVALELGSGFVTRRVVGLADGQTPIFEVRGAWALGALAAGFVY